ncbi:MAG: ABC transporter substrate-binding protein, partial [Candidatus Omnitrophica bacterium]|nr:ABC transporter substrate-binding protein [Candidatus Omnitrophota bacterium]
QSVSAPLQDLIFNKLIRWSSKGDVEPDLAERWDVSRDGLVYTFYLRKGVKFHDGVECTAEDVKFTFDKIIDPQVNSPFRSSFQLVKDFKVIDRYIFQVILKEPSASFIYRLIREIVPKHLLEKADLRSSYFNFHPIGTGPFKFKDWTNDNQIILEYNPDYYEGRPYLDEIMVKTYSDSRELWAALMRQEIDLVLFLEREDYEIVKKDPSFKTYVFPVDGYYAVVYNLDDPILADKKAREAIASAIDRKSLIQRIAFGYGLESDGPFYPDSFAFNPQVKPIEFNPDKATALLSEAGWKDIDQDGVLEKDEEELEIRILVDARNDIQRRIIMLLRQQLQEVGIKLKVQLCNDEKMLTQEFLEQNKSQAQLKLLLAGIDPDSIREEWSLQGFQGGHNLWPYKNQEVERYFALGKINQDKKKREWIYQEIHRFIYQDQPVCFLYFPFWFHAVSAKFENTDKLFTLSMPFYVMKDWSLKQKVIVKKKGGEERYGDY